MQWLQLIEIEDVPLQKKQLKILKKWKKFTIYDHNSHVSIDQQAQTFTCVFNCKKINSQHSVIGKIKGSFKTNNIVISNTLTDNQTLLSGKWQYQKIQLTRFAFRYNERSHKNILIKVNPTNGQVMVCMNFFISANLFSDEQTYKQIMTDYCQILGQESEKIFNTMTEIIYQRQSNEPYLKSGIKVNPNFPRYMKVEKLLDKVKSLMATSSFYQIKIDTTSAHKNRSYFKKLYLSNDKKYIKQDEICRMALLYELKYNKVYEKASRQMFRQKTKQYIKDYTQLQQKNETQFAKHLNENEKFQGQACLPIGISSVADCHQNQTEDIKKIVQTTNNSQIKVLIDSYESGQQSKHTWAILKRLQRNHPNITQYYVDQKKPQLRITEGFDSIYFEQFLLRNKKTISLSTKFDLMAQTCHALQYMHKKCIGCFFRLNDIVVDRNYKVKVRNLSFSYAVNQTIGWRDAKNKHQNNQGSNITIDYLNTQLEFPFINIASGLQMNRQQLNKCLDNDKCDIFSLGIVLYRIMMDKYPFFIDSITKELPRLNIDQYQSFWKHLWTVQTQYFLTQGGPIAKIVTHLLLKCFNSNSIPSRPFVEWLTVILSEIKTSLNGLY